MVLIILMSATTFTTQRQLMMKNMPASALDNPFAQQQKILLYVLPLVFAVSGVNFPIGVLIYWLTTNVWSMGQQFYVIRRMPAPGSPAEKALMERRARRGKGLSGKGLSGKDSSEIEDEAAQAAQQTGGQRQQPKRKPKSKRSPASGLAGGTTASVPRTGTADGADVSGTRDAGSKRDSGTASGRGGRSQGEGKGGRPTKGR